MISTATLPYPKPFGTQALKQTLPPSDSNAIRKRVFDCKYMSCEICFNVLNYVFILFTFNLYCLVNFNSLATILAVVTDNTKVS